MTKQVIVVRKDLPWTKGKISAQVAHASQSFLLENYDGSKTLTVNLSKDEIRWLTVDQHTKIVLNIDSLEELENLFTTAKSKGLTVRKITDAGRTVFKEPTVTCIAIGPNNIEDIDSVTKHLKLM